MGEGVARPARPGRWDRVAAMVAMGRPMLLPGGILAYALGAAMGYGRTGSFDWGRALAGLAATEVANLVAHYADEYADVDTDTLARQTWFSGGSGVLPAGRVPAAWALRAAIGLAVLALALTGLLVAAGVLPRPAAWILGLGLAGGWLYSMPPVQLERRGLGEPVNAAIGGLLMPLMGYTVQVGRPDLDAGLALLPVALLVLVHLLGIHWADREADAAVGKRSLAVVAGRRVRAVHHGLLVGAYVLVAVLTGPVLPVAVSVALGVALPANLWAAVTFVPRPSSVPSALAMAASLVAAAMGWIVAAG
jgi:1,4-dihydroxy-2-naphthoate octaprenyltransferase